jgi:endonuclease YncB( thermonuclease family)
MGPCQGSAVRNRIPSRQRTGPLAFALLLLLALPGAAAPQSLEGLVTGVADGDTLIVLDGAKASLRIRLLGIDAPEGGQPYGKVAKQVLLGRVIRQRVTVLTHSRDRYGRLVGKVLLEGVDVNLELVREGLAWHYKHYAGDQFPGDARLYAQAEDEARQARKGLWNDREPEAPWLWRRTHRRPE